MRIVVLGASGFVGKHLVEALRARGDDVVTASLRNIGDASRASSESDAIVNLAGESVAQRWSAQAKERIRSSRIDMPRALIERLRRVPYPPKAWISASAIGYYGTDPEATFTEASPPGTGFLAEVCTGWEEVAQSAAQFGARVAIARCGLVLGNDGGAFPRLALPFRLGLGGRAATGRQWYSWVHIDDVVGIYLAAVDGLGGVLNATAPEPVRNTEFSAALGRAVRRPAFLPAPEFAFRLMLGEAATMITEGQRVLPERTMALGYQFKYPAIDGALAQLTS